MMKNSGKKETSMTAKVSAFARAWHREHSPRPVFDDPLAKALLGEDFLQIAGQMAAGIGFFAPDFSGTEEEALTHIVNTQLGPLPLARAAFGEQALEQAAACGAGQYLILGAGYDSFALRQPEWARNMTVYELDLPDTAADKQERLRRAGLSVPDNVRYVQADLTAPDWTQRLKQAGFAPGVPTFCALPGVSYYLPHGALKELLLDLGGRGGGAHAPVLCPHRAGGAAGGRRLPADPAAGRNRHCGDAFFRPRPCLAGAAHAPRSRRGPVSRGKDRGLREGQPCFTVSRVRLRHHLPWR